MTSALTKVISLPSDPAAERPQSAPIARVAPAVPVAPSAATRSLAAVGTDQFEALISWVAECAVPGARLVDVGAGDGVLDYPSRLAGSVGRIVGIDPGVRIHDNHRVDECVQMTLEEFAPAHADRFDLAVAIYVVEHVAEPEPFMVALHTCLRPGGTAFVLTPSRWHYFGLLALAAERLGIDEWLLHRIRDERVLHDHHVPIQYRMNSWAAMDRLRRGAGFRAMEVMMIDHPGIYQPYFPGALKRMPAWYSALVHRLGRPSMAGTMLVRLDK
jgi:SAM-dependent methyltransferase